MKYRLLLAVVFGSEVGGQCDFNIFSQVSLCNLTCVLNFAQGFLARAKSSAQDKARTEAYYVKPSETSHFYSELRTPSRCEY